MNHYCKIGKLIGTNEDMCTVTVIFGETTQGEVYKDEEAYYQYNKICYVPELCGEHRQFEKDGSLTTDDFYTGQDFLDMCNGQEEIAKALFDDVRWQHPETLINEWFEEGEVGSNPFTADEHIYFRYQTPKCKKPHRFKIDQINWEKCSDIPFFRYFEDGINSVNILLGSVKSVKDKVYVERDVETNEEYLIFNTDDFGIVDDAYNALAKYLTGRTGFYDAIAKEE